MIFFKKNYFKTMPIDYHTLSGGVRELKLKLHINVSVNNAGSS